ncbi:AAA family ATPase [Moorena sp. SIO4G3]|uniref:AAA family ATPase n=1 Tax=Moorena sp. SIO4G3 TaxID=2607821 RepID=UPI001429DA60|nr:AAA family ATPase [Moorena sp. SIO4G3]NEO76152.1 AAA family ATPase [Moorena sp. SIO4G3]
MISLPGYQISTQIHQSTNSLVYRGSRESDNLPIVIKVLRQDYPTPTQLTRYKQEYQITHNLDLVGVIKALDLEAYQNTLVIIFEDFGAKSLKRLYQENQFTLKEFLQIAIAICDALGNLHNAKIIHKDINPANIVYNPDTKQLKIIDFGISTRLSQENPTLKNPELLEGTLAYISPEQTGRMNRCVDYRSDFYSLGVSLYELLTGKLPFETKDSLELIYCHLAKQTLPPNNIVVENHDSPLPQMISDIVMKLMAKTAEERYQSAWGIKADLEECLQQLESTGGIESFPLATQDMAHQFQIPQKLYGREKEIENLIASFNRISSSSQTTKTELFLVSGYSGIGKSALVKEVYKPITEKKGYFVSGKFDQYQRNIPYYAVIQSLKELIKQLLTESEAQLKQWRDKLEAALGVNGQVIVDVIPELELIIGKQPAIPDLAGQEAQNRFNLVFQNFIQVFTQPEHPLVLFLDDLQWADLASLKLMELLVNTPDVNSLLLIGAYRDNEVSAVHPLILTIKSIKEASNIVNEIVLKSLDLADINQLVADTLHSTKETVKPLAELLQLKTNGNPFFLREFFKSLYDDILLVFDSIFFTWQWDLTQIKAQQITDNVVELMAQKIKKLPDLTQETLKLSSCIGNKFDIATLAIVAETSPQEVALSLHEAISQGLILPLSEQYKSIELDVIKEDYSQVTKQVAYKFVHDRIQQAAYSLIAEADKSAKHLQIGKLLLQNTTEAEQEESIFDLVNQFNKARELITNQSERDECAQLNLIACRKARSAAAYESGLEYAHIGLSWLGENAWQRQYEISIEFHNLGAELASLCGNFEVMEQFIETVLEQAESLWDRVDVYRTIIQTKVSQNQLTESIAIAQEILQQFGIIFPEQPTQDDVQQATSEISKLIGDREIEDLVNLPIMTDPEKIAIVQIANSIIPATHNVGSLLFPLVNALIVKLSIQYGNISASIFAYASYGTVVSTFLQDVSKGEKFALLGLQLVSKLDAKAAKSEVIVTIATIIAHQKSHLKKTLPLLQEGYRTALEVGSLEVLGYNASSFCLNSFWCGQPLTSLEQETRSYCIKLEQFNQLNTVNHCQISCQPILNLLGVTENPTILSGEALKESEFLPEIISANDSSMLFIFYGYKLMLCYLFEEIESAQNHAIEVGRYLSAGVGTVVEPAFYFYDSLTTLAILSSSSAETSELWERVEKNQTKLQQQWAHYAPMNYQHKYLLVQAEKYRVLGNHSEAINLYDRAIKLAHENEFIHEEALAYELAAKFYLGRENELVASVYLKQARYCYLQWGAKAKVKHLDDKYPELLATIVEPSNPNPTTTTSSETQSETLDLATLIKTSQALSQITDFSQLLETLIKFVLENAGAEKGFLILVQSDNLIIQASGTTESIITLQADRLEDCHDLSQTVINYVYRTQENLVLNNASDASLFMPDHYIASNQIKSVLCLPILNQGRIIAILYLENNLAVNVFTADRLEVLKLISSQAAISIENALLRQQEQENVFAYQVGGCLTINSPTYVVRQADIDLYQSLKQGHYCYVLNSRQMGKSSLRVRIMNKLQIEGTVCAAIDLTSIGSNVTMEQWYAGVIYNLVSSFKLGSQFKFRSWWRSLYLLSPVQKFSEFIKQILLRTIRGKIVIFIDEIDRTLGLKFNLDEFFAAIRACYNLRSDNPEDQRLSFVLLGVASPSSLVQDKNCTPFNIGRAIALESFKLHEVKPLIQGLAEQFSNPQAIIKQVLFWTGGQPFLTQKICNLIVAYQDTIVAGQETQWVDNFIQETIIDNWEFNDDPQHFKTISDRLLKSSSESTQLLQLYQQLLEQGEVIADASNEHQDLLLTGLVKQEQGKLKVYNPIYQAVFSLDWCEGILNS